MFQDVPDKSQFEALAEIPFRRRVHAYDIESAGVQFLDQVLEDVHAHAAPGKLDDAAVSPPGAVDIAQAVRYDADIQDRPALHQKLDELQQVEIGMDLAHREQVVSRGVDRCSAVRIVADARPVYERWHDSVLMTEPRINCSPESLANAARGQER